MTVSSPSAPESSGAREPRHRASGGRGSTGGDGSTGDEGATDDRPDAAPSGPVPAPRRAGGRHRAPAAAPTSTSFAAVPAPRAAPTDEGAGDEPGPAAGFRPLPPSGFPDATSSVGVPLGAVPAQRETAVPRRRPAYASPRTVHDDDAVTVPVRRDALDRAASRGPVDQDSHAAADQDAPALRPLSVQRPEAEPRYRPGQRIEPGTPPRAEVPSRPAVSRRGSTPWATPPVDRASTRLGLVALVTGVLGVLVGLAPWSGLLPRVLPQSALGAIPVFNLVGALLGVVGLGVGAVAMFRASDASRGLLVGVLGACLGAAAVVVGLLV